METGQRVTGTLGDWTSEVTSVYLSIRRFGFGSGVFIATALTLWFSWVPGWIVVALCASVVVHSYLYQPVRLDRDVPIDAVVLGLITLLMDTPGGWVILTLPIAVAALTGERRTAGYAMAIVTAFLLAPLLAPQWFSMGQIGWLPDSFRSSDMPAAERTNLASSVLIGVLVLNIWLISTRMRAIERRRAVALATIAHDLRNAVGAVRGLGSSLVSDPSEVETTAEALVASADEALHLSDDVYAIARLHMERSAAERRDFLLDETARSTLAGFGEVELTSMATMVVGDRNRTAQIIRNLVGNSIRHGGPPIEVTVYRNGGLGIVAVSDGGVGMPPGVEASLFAPQRSEGDGMGIGLATSAAFANEMGGTLTYAREADRTVFELALPLAR